MPHFRVLNENLKIDSLIVSKDFLQCLLDLFSSRINLSYQGPDCWLRVLFKNDFICQVVSCVRALYVSSTRELF